MGFMLLGHYMWFQLNSAQ